MDLVVQPGTVHAVVGENGAGKSTLMKIAYGLMRADAGRIAIRGEPIPRTRHSPAAALARGVGMVHQHFMLVGPLTVAENLVLGHEPTRGGLVLDLARAERELTALAARFGIAIDPRRRIADLSVGEQQRVELLRILWRGANILILDEPTAVLTPGEVRSLFDTLRALVAEGKTVVLVTHKLDEVHAIADRVTVLRKGEVVAELPGGSPPEDIARAMVGRPVLLDVPKGPSPMTADVVLAVRDLRVAGLAKDAVAGVSFEVRKGEILGFAGVEGNGQAELVEALAGLRPLAAGTVELGGHDLARSSVADRHRLGMSLVSEDRQGRGLVLEMTIAENLSLGRLGEVRGRFGLDRQAIARRAAAAIADLGITPDDPDAIVSTLSGGNQQKVVLARELGRPGLRLLVCAQPTRGVDIGAIEVIYQRLLAARDAGVAIVLVSAELAELRALADRVAVLHRGKIVDVVPGSALSDSHELERVGSLMTGAAT
ncbi:MAG: ABC transporter ATP-binding protein [Myxococcota bacterium]